MYLIKVALGRAVVLATLCITAGNAARRMPPSVCGRVWKVNSVVTDLKARIMKWETKTTDEMPARGVDTYSVYGPMTSGKSAVLMRLMQAGIPCVTATYYYVGDSISTRDPEAHTQRILADVVVGGRKPWAMQFQDILRERALDARAAGRRVITVLPDEFQFPTTGEANTFMRIAQRVATRYGIRVAVVFFHLDLDSDGRLFSGTEAIRSFLLLQSYRLKAKCPCGKPAPFTGRYGRLSGKRLFDQDQVVVDGTPDIIYDPTCEEHWDEDLPPEVLEALSRG
ncbi:MAG: hypothetical protein LBR78_02915 [Holosporales bacterium]|jgi:thymidine kinase|nr:hypothetical protein [Holosporales bacterium]